MEYVELGRTGLKVSRTSFGALPIQRINFEEAKALLMKAYENGVNFFDTARAYSDSEEKIGYALSHVREKIIIATKTASGNTKAIRNDLEKSLQALKTDYIDLYQFHTPKELPSEELYEQMLQFKKEGKIRFIGLTNHSMKVVEEAVESGLYDTIQFPFSSLSDERDVNLVRTCKERNIGFIAMKAMSGGLIQNVPANFGGIRQFENVVPIWGIQKESELDEFIALENNPPTYNEELQKTIQKEKEALGGKFCRGCGYCKPCPVDIPLDFACRMDLLLRRAVTKNFVTEEWQEIMGRIEKCTMCKACAKRCPYGLVPYDIIKEQLSYYKKTVEEYSE